MAREPEGMEHALLGLLRDRPMHAYEVHRALIGSGDLGLVWRVKQAHLYAMLSRLEAGGFLGGRIEHQGARPPRRVLHLTPEGSAALARWLDSPVAHGRDFRLEFLAKLYIASRESPARAAHLLTVQRAACQDWLRAVADLSDARRAAGGYAWLVYEFRRTQIEAILDWLRICEGALVAPVGH